MRNFSIAFGVTTELMLGHWTRLWLQKGSGYTVGMVACVVNKLSLCRHKDTIMHYYKRQLLGVLLREPTLVHSPTGKYILASAYFYEANNSLNG